MFGPFCLDCANSFHCSHNNKFKFACLFGLLQNSEIELTPFSPPAFCLPKVFMSDFPWFAVISTRIVAFLNLVCEFARVGFKEGKGESMSLTYDEIDLSR